MVTTAPIHVRAHGASDVGCARDSNEDAWLIGDLDAGAEVPAEGSLELDMALGPVLLVCDGMGGAAGGEVASALAVAAVWRELVAGRSETLADEPEIVGRNLRRAIRIAHAEIAQHARTHKLRGMGTTLCAAAIAGEQLVLGTVGDSRAYLLRGGNLVQVTRDQSVQSVLRAHGKADSATGNAILQAVGVGADVEPSLSFVPLCVGDRILLCSDGLHGPLGPSVIAGILDEELTVAEIAARFIAAARKAGGPDNITAVVAEVEGPRLPPPADGEVPTFREFDPHQEGESALTATSHVVRRLAAQSGLEHRRGRRRALPVTGQHRSIVDPNPVTPSALPLLASTPIRSEPHAARPWLRWALFAVAAITVGVLAWIAAGA